MSMKFILQHKDPSSHARAGELHTDHGVIRTPIFMPVGTAATVKGIFHRDVRDEARAQIILANTYHLYLRPGMEILERAGGVHRFSTWEGPMLTDSGGFQVFSLAACRKLKEEGCHFRSHIDGSKHLFTPESVMEKVPTLVFTLSIYVSTRLTFDQLMAVTDPLLPPVISDNFIETALSPVCKFRFPTQ